jgi:SAM-dependent methyltransferase
MLRERSGTGDPLVVARGLQLQILPNGRFATSVSLSRKPQDLDLDGLIVLLRFASAATVDEVFTHLETEYDVDRRSTDALIASLLEAGLLVRTGTESVLEAATLAPGGFASALGHHFMLRDLYRVLAYKGAIERAVAGKTVCEIGCGTGILSIFAAKAGAKQVTAIEESGVAVVAQRMFERNGVAGQVHLIRGNSRDVTLPEPVEVLVHEILGNDPLGESILPVIQDARRRFLRLGGVMIPGRLVLGCVGIDLPRSSPPEEVLSQQASDLGAIYGIDLSAHRDALVAESHEPVQLRFNSESLEPLLLTSESQVVELDFMLDDDLESFDVTRELLVQRSGTLRGVAVFFRARLDGQVELTNSPFTPSTHWGQLAVKLPREVSVETGDRVGIRVRQKTTLGARRMSVELLS